MRTGATVMFSEVTEAVHLLTARAKEEVVAEALIRERDWYDRYLTTADRIELRAAEPG